MEKDSFIAKPSPLAEYNTPHVQPIYPSSSYRFSSLEEGIDIFTGQKKGHIYGRFGNANVETTAQKIAELEGMGLDFSPSGVMVSSGMAAISTLLLALANPGDTIIAPPDLYGGTIELLNKVIDQKGLQVVYSSFTDHDILEDNIKKSSGNKILLFETPTNPTLTMVDIKKVTALGHTYGAQVIVDNTFMTPYLQQPFAYGVDYIIHSTTKFINGHGNSIAGVIIGKNAEDMKSKVWTTMKLMGTNCSPWDAWLTSQGMKTLAVRMDKHCANAMQVAQFLDQHPDVEKVNYPGLESFSYHDLSKRQMNGHGAMLSFSVNGGLEEAKSAMNKFRFISIAPTLGDTDTLALHPATMSHLNIDKEIRLSQGITDNLIRLSNGIENPKDIINDLEKALA